MTVTQQQGNPVTRFAKTVIRSVRNINGELTGAGGKPWRVLTASRSRARRQAWSRPSRLTPPERYWLEPDLPALSAFDHDAPPVNRRGVGLQAAIMALLLHPLGD
jgi:hypothetical protein